MMRLINKRVSWKGKFARFCGLVTGAIGALGVLNAASAGEQFVGPNGVANFGYDVVAYHATFTPTEGSEAFSATYNGAPFWFASAENRDRFVENPELYAPAYDGHCAFALVSHKKLTVDPEAFSIIDPETGLQVEQEAYSIEQPGILYLNYSTKVNAQFNDGLPDIIAEADFAWDDCLERQPAAKPRKSFRDFFGGGRPKDCPAPASD